MNLSETGSTGPRPFDPIDAAVGVILRPVPAMRSIATARPWLAALILYAVISILGGLVGLTAPPPDPADLAELAEVSPGFAELLAAFFDPMTQLILAIVLAPVGLLFWSAVLYGIGYILGGRSPFSALFSTVAYAGVPYVPLAPLFLLINLGGTALVPVSFLVAIGLWVWTVVLTFIGLREAMALSTGQAAGAIAIQYAIGIILLCMLSFIVVVAFAATIDPAAL